MMSDLLSESLSPFQYLSVLNTAVTLSAVNDGSGKSVCGYMPNVCFLLRAILL